MDTTSPVFYIPATIDHAIWQSADGDFGILSAKLNSHSCHYRQNSYPASWRKKEKIVIKSGGLNSVGQFIGKPMVFAGKIVNHEKYGDQFQADYCFTDIPSTVFDMRGYLTTLPNIGDFRADKIIERFSLKEIEEVFSFHPDRLVAMKIGLTEVRAKAAQEQWNKDSVVRQVYLWTAKNGISSFIADKIVKEWGNRAIDILEADPYQLTKFSGVGFKTADDIAYRILRDVPADRRTKSCLRFLLDDIARQDGHLGVPLDILRSKALGLLIERDQSRMEEYSQCIDQILERSGLFAAVKNGENEILIYDWSIWDQECFIADSLVRLSNVKSDFGCTEKEIDEAQEELREYFDKPDIVLDENQRLAIHSVMENPITVLTGGGGTGKSTICRCIVNIARSKNKSVCLLAPTGKAAKVLTKKTSGVAYTIHRRLQMKPGESVGNAVLSEDIILIDETSMCGADTMYAVMDGIRRGNSRAHLVLVGDPKQLPSVSPGNFLFDIISSGIANVIRLQQIYRQGKNSYITVVANDIADGKTTSIPSDAIDIAWKEIENTAHVAPIVSQLVLQHLQAGFDVQEIQVLSPMYRYECGVDRINSVIQESVAKYRHLENNCIALKFNKFYQGDKVIQLENDYEKDVFNGDVGIVEHVGRKIFNPNVSNVPEPFVAVNYKDGRPLIFYRSTDIEQIRPAWCITVHKFQGSQCKRIVFVLAREHQIMANRELVYTAITRGEKMVFIIGDTRMLKLAPTRSSIHKRYTSLVDLICQKQTGDQLLTLLTEQDVLEETEVEM